MNITVKEGSVVVYNETVNHEVYSSLSENEGVYTRVKAADPVVDLSSYLSSNLPNDIVWTIGETNVTSNVTVSGKTVSMNFADTGLYGDLALRGTNDTMNILINYHVTTAVITTADELIHWKSYADTFTGGTKGYFELGNNIDLDGARLNAYVDDTDGGTSNEEDIYKGFNGTFDGKGYTIYNGIFDKNGLFGYQIGKNALVKNLAIVKMTASNDYVYVHLLANLVYGRIEECLFEISDREGVYPGGGGAVVAGWAAGDYVNVITYQAFTDYFYFGFSQYIGWNGYTPVTGSRTNTYSIGGKNYDASNQNAAWDKMFGKSSTAYAVGTSCETIGFASKGFNEDLWDFSGNKARFKSYTTQ